MMFAGVEYTLSTLIYRQVLVAKQRINKWSAESDQQAEGDEQNA